MSFKVRQINEGGKKRQGFLAKKKAAILAMTLLKPFAGLYQSWKARKEREERRQARVLMLKRLLAILISLLVATFLLAGIAKALFSIQFSLSSFISVAGTELSIDEGGYTNFLILGGGDDDHDGKDLLDTIIVASIDPDKKGSISMLSLPRDLYFLRTENMGKGRINSLYRDYKGYLLAQGKNQKDASAEALQEVKREVGNALNLPLHYVIKINFTAFEQTVDALDGIDINVPYDIVDTEYPGPNFTFQTFEISAGPQKLDGALALKYARSRHTTSDFDRSARQQQIMVAAANKVKETKLYKDIGKITELYQILADNLETDLKMTELITLASIADQFDPGNVMTMQLSDRNGLFGDIVLPGGFLYTPPRDEFEGASVLLPVSIPEFPVTWNQIQALTALFFGKRDLYLAQPRIAVLNAGAPEGTARKLGKELERYGFPPVSIRNYDEEKQASSFVAIKAPTEGEDIRFQGHLGFFAEVLRIRTAEEPFAANRGFEENPDLVIVLGKDATYQPLQNLLP